MNPQIFHIYGPFYIQSYGLMIVLGLLIFLWRAQKSDLRKALFTEDQFMALVFRGLIAAFVGGKVLHIISDWHEYRSWQDYLSFWEGGFSILGSIIAVLIYMIWYLRKNKIPLLPTLDFLAVYAPLLQAIARIGCFFAGCCYGAPTVMPWGVVYTESSSAAPCFIPLHPTQLYSALSLFTVFLFLRFILYPWLKKNDLMGYGFIACIYLMLACAERFTIDFWRADRIFDGSSVLIKSTLFSMHQWIALGIIVLSGIAAVCLFYLKRKA